MIRAKQAHSKQGEASGLWGRPDDGRRDEAASREEGTASLPACLPGMAMLACRQTGQHVRWRRAGDMEGKACRERHARERSNQAFRCNIAA